jgi:glucose-1-phosphate adenylyltransferase
VLDDVLVIVLAGGAGERLYPLTKERAKPAVYFGGPYRIIDFTLSNCINSGLRKIFIALQYKSLSLSRHLRMGWSVVADELGEFVEILSPQKRVGEHWYLGTADAVYQNLYSILRESPRHLIVLSGDHVYKMDYAKMLTQHVEQGADVTVGCIEVPRMEAVAFGVMHVDEQDRIIAFVEKPADPPPIPGSPNTALASMGIYVFATRFLIDQLRRDESDKSSNRDFGRDIIPYLVQHGKAVAHRFTSSCVTSGAEREAYWRDVGTLDAYWEANIDLTEIIPALDLYDRDWPIWTYAEVTPPAKFVHEEVGRRGEAISSLVSGGCIVSGSFLRQSLLFTGVHVHSYARVEQAVVLPDADIGRGARLRNVIVERGVRIPPGLVVGEDAVADASRFRRTERGICLITQPMIDRLDRPG